jgi:hemophore-related protein
LAEIAAQNTLAGCNAVDAGSAAAIGPVCASSASLPWIPGTGKQQHIRNSKEERHMKFSDIQARRRIVGACAAGSLLGGLALATITAPSAMADPCSASELSGTVSSATGSARAYLASHPGANQAVTTAFSQPRDQAAATLRGYFTANPQEYYALRGILAPIGDKQSQCNVSVLPPDLASAYSQFMAG